MLLVQEVTKKYGKVLANDGVSFETHPGEISILLGPNGAGKSTLIKCIAGLLKFSGRILINGIVCVYLCYYRTIHRLQSL